MIGFISGIVLSSDGHNVIILTPSGVGYTVSLATKSEISLAEGNEVELYIYTHVRENEISLYGFANKFDQTVFELLLSVSGVGPKAAQTILLTHGAEKVVGSTVNGDTAGIQAPGVGKRTAEKVCLDLKDKFEKLGLVSKDGTSRSNVSSEVEDQLFAEVESAFISLGFSKNEIRLLYYDIIESNPDYTTPEEVVREGLRRV
ncbi:Holliday junction branch migration protein RuvA [Candidatus Dojkabacteria bacterium]|uniref:Holliday junction branch migration complex subunit RuvA n=1 Tax=Candidatus Dojkabacteria bacterium TaxID=2099670 RepID=A0A955L3E4_9BACT|nr:Holliday junction branch migration protein RuvA [Candidatus Dojkabacteria bacterium]